MSSDLHAALAAVREVVNLHRPDGEGWCVEDGFSWPCATARAVSLVLDSDDAHPATDADLISEAEQRGAAAERARITSALRHCEPALLLDRDIRAALRGGAS